MRAINSFVVHHSASASGSVEQFRREHRAKGWSDVGYHAVIGNGRGQGDGEVREGRSEAVDGAGVWGNNAGRLHVCLVGNFQKGDPGFTGRPTLGQLNAVEKWLETRVKKYGPKPLYGHLQLAKPGHATACPGSEFPMEILLQWYLRVIECWTQGDKVKVSLLSFLRCCGYLPATGGVLATEAPIIVRCQTPGTAVLAGEERVMPSTARIIDGQVWAPVRDLVLTLGLPEPKWNPATKTVTIARSGKVT